MAENRNDYTQVIQKVAREIDRRFKNKNLWAKDEELTQLFSIYYTAIYEQVHNVLHPMKTEKSEKELRDILAKYVIGYVDKKKGISFIGSINPIKAKLMQISNNKKTSKELLARYLDLYDNFMALASFRSFKHYCLYFEEVYAPEDKKIWVHAEKHGIAEGMW